MSALSSVPVGRSPMSTTRIVVGTAMTMVIGIEVISENVKAGTVKHTNTCYFTMVAKGEDDKPTRVPPLILESTIEVRRFVEAIYRKKFKQNYQANLREIKKDWENQDIDSLLKKERCFDRSKTLK